MSAIALSRRDITLSTYPKPRRERLRVLRENQRRVLYGAPEYDSSDMSPDDAVLLSERKDGLRRSLSRLRTSDRATLRRP